MGKHSVGPRGDAGGHRGEGISRRARRVWIAAGLTVLAAGSVTAVMLGLNKSAPPSDRSLTHLGSATAPATDQSPACSRTITVVTASSFAPALTRIAAPLATGPDCVAVQVRTADGRDAAGVVAATGADAWIPDNSSWSKLPNPAKLATGRLHAGTVVATSPLYIVTQRNAPALPPAARSWTGLTELLAQHGSPWHLILGDPATSGDAMVGAGGLADAELTANGPLVSALDMLRVWQAGTKLTTSGPALPTRPDQVGVVPEYALLQSQQAGNYTLTVPTDGTSLLNYTWFPSAAAAADPDKAQALTRLYQVLTGSSAAPVLSAAGLRGPIWPAAAPTAAAEAGLPAITATPMAPISEHFMYHVLATWHPELRRSNMLIVIDVSGSMADPAPGTQTPKIALARQGIAQVSSLLPDSAQLGVWQFGSQLEPPDDWQQLVAPAPLTAAQRDSIGTAGEGLNAQSTGTGLYDTILGAYRYQQAHYQAGMPNEVVLFTDGVNQDDPDSISLDQLHADLAATDPGKRVQLSIFGIGDALPAKDITAALTPVGGQVDQLENPDQIMGAFVHAVSGALSGVPG